MCSTGRSRSTPSIVSVEDLAAKIAANQDNLVVIDVRWYLSGKSGSAAYAEGHLPGAVFVDLDRSLASDPKAGPGRHPLPAADVFQDAMRDAGVWNSSFVVAYDDANSFLVTSLGRTAMERITAAVSATAGEQAVDAVLVGLSRAHLPTDDVDLEFGEWRRELLVDEDHLRSRQFASFQLVEQPVEALEVGAILPLADVLHGRVDHQELGQRSLQRCCDAMHGDSETRLEQVFFATTADRCE